MLPGLIIAGLGLFFLYAGTIGAGNSIYGFTWVNTTNIDATNYYYDGVNYTQFIVDLIPVAGGGIFNQDLNTTDAVIFVTVDTGQGANELYDMNQNVLTTSSVTFDNVTVSDTLTLGGVGRTTWPTGGGADGLAYGGYTYLVTKNQTTNEYEYWNKTGSLLARDPRYHKIIYWAWQNCSSLGGGHIYQAEGKYYLNNNITFHNVSNILWSGSYGAKIIPAQNTSGSGLSSFQWGNEAGDNYGYNITIRDLFFNTSLLTTYTTGSFLKFEELCDDINIENCHFEGGECFTFIYGEECPGKVNIDHCSFYYCKSSTGIVHPHSGHRWTLTNCLFENTRGEAFRHIQLADGNILKNHDNTGAVEGFAIVGCDDSYDESWVFTNNVIDCNGNGVLTWDSRSHLSGNMYYCNGISIRVANTHCSVDNEYIYGSTEGAPTIDITSGGDYSTISNIHVVQNYDIVVRGVDAQACDIAEVYAWRPDHGSETGDDDIISLTKCNNSRVSGIHSINDQAGKYARYGVYLNACENVTVRDSVFRDIEEAFYLLNCNYCSVRGIQAGFNWTISGGNNNLVAENEIFDGTNTGTNSQIYNNYDPWNGGWITKVNGP